MTNSQRFLDAYNKADKALHTRFDFKQSMSFTEAVRRAASVNSVVRRFEDDLESYGRLRNSIVHSSDSQKTIAEPHDDVTDRFEHIAELLATPPLASTVSHKARTVTPSAALDDAVKTMARLDYSIMPVVDGGKIIGVLTNKGVTLHIAKLLSDGVADISDSRVADAVADGKAYFYIMPDGPIDEVVKAFEKNRKITMIVLTKDGTPDSDIIGVITVGDLVAVNKLLEEY